MKSSQIFPSFDAFFPDLDRFVRELVELHDAGKIKSWRDLEENVNVFFKPEMIELMETISSGWKKMASYAGGITLTHVMCVFLGLFMLPEFKSLSRENQQIAKWIVFFHDIEKEINKGSRDFTHGFRSATFAARSLPSLGFDFTSEYKNLIKVWSEFTNSAFVNSEDLSSDIQDNRKLPEILLGIEKMFGKYTPAALIVKCVLLHMSINVVSDYPQAAPLTDEEIAKYVDTETSLLLKAMCLADNEGWSMFYPEIRARQRNDTLKAFEKIERMLLNAK